MPAMSAFDHSDLDGRLLQLLAAAKQAGVARIGFVAESTGAGRGP